MSHSSAAAQLVRVADWGHTSVLEMGSGEAVEIHRLNVRDGRGDAALALAQRWRKVDHPAFTDLRSCAVARTAVGEIILEVERSAPSGSTLEEVLTENGQLDGVMVAGLFFELVDALRSAHAQQLVVGQVTPASLYVCPPGVNGVAALRVHPAGLVSMIDAAGGPLGTADKVRFQQVFRELRCIAPEVALGGASTAASDTYMVCASIARALLGRHVHGGADKWAILERVRSGLRAEDRDALLEAAPGLGQLIARGMSLEPFLRRGLLGELNDAFKQLLGEQRCSRLSVTAGGEPWQMGSPLIPLAAFVRARPYVTRFAAAPEARIHAPTGGQILSGSPPPTPVDNATTRAVDAARMSAAIHELKLLRARAEREEGARPNKVVRLVVVLVTVAIAWAIAYIGLQRTEALRSSNRSRPVPATRKLPQAPQPRVLYTTPKPE